MTDREIISNAREWVGTKWMHGACIKGYRVDCIQFIVAIAKQNGWLPLDYKTKPYNQDYALHNSASLIKKEIGEYCYKVDTPQIGDVLLFTFGKCASHAGVYVGRDKIIHAHIKYGVIEDNVDYSKLDSTWRFNG